MSFLNLLLLSHRVGAVAALLAAGLRLAAAEHSAAGDGELEVLMRQPLVSADRPQTTITSVGKHSQKLSETAAAVYVITADDIRRSGATSIPDALRMAPGLDVARIDSNKWAVGSRGFNGRFANKLLVLMDGREVYSPTFGGVYWEVQDLLLHDIERIEVIRGPGASLWGANAVNGVINIITKSAADTLGGRLTAGGGTFEKNFGSFRYGAQLGEATTGRVWALGFNRGEFDNAAGRPADGQSSMARTGFRIDHDAQDGEALMVQGQAYSGELNQMLRLPSIRSPYSAFYHDRATVSGYNLLGRWQKAFSVSSQLSIQAFFDHTLREELFVDEQRNTFDLELQHRLSYGEHHSFIWGLGYRLTRDRFIDTVTVDFDDHRTGRQLFSAFVQDDISLVEHELTLTLGSKFQHNDYTGVEVQPTVRLAWTPNTVHTLWGAVSRAVRTPSRFEGDGGELLGGRLPPFTDQNVTPYPVLLRPRSNGGFGAEELIALELGYRFKPSPSLFVDVAGFYNRYEDIRGIDFGTVTIEQVRTPTPHWLVGGAMVNSVSAQSIGLEWLTHWRAMPWWQIELSYSFIKTSFQSHRGPLNFTQEQGFNPEQQVSVRSSLDVTDDVELDLWFRYTDALPLNRMGLQSAPAKIPGYSTLDARLAWRAWQGLELSVVGQNLIDARHIEFDQEVLSPPRNFVPRGVYFKFDWKF